MPTPGHIAVVGASLAGLRAVETLRRRGFDGRISVVGAESALPYDRPPLSKEILQGKWEPERTRLRDPASYDELEVDWRLGVRATGLDTATRELELDGRERRGFDRLLIATGASPRRLPGTPELDGIHTLRTLDDALAIRAALERGPRVVVVGAGFIGAEVAASCRERGLDVTMLEALPVPLGRAIGAKLGRWLADAHRDRGVDLRCGVGVAGFEGARRLERVRLDDDTLIEADLAVVGIGVAPETDWLRSSGIELRDGIVCDATCATSVPGITAAGDVARWHNPLFSTEMRVEHWTNAAEQGAAAGLRLLCEDHEAAPFAPVPFFWSDQYELKLQMVGHVSGEDELRIVQGSPAEGRFLALYGREGRFTGAFGLNRARQVMQQRVRIAEGISFDEAIAQAS